MGLGLGSGLGVGLGLWVGSGFGVGSGLGVEMSPKIHCQSHRMKKCQNTHLHKCGRLLHLCRFLDRGYVSHKRGPELSRKCKFSE